MKTPEEWAKHLHLWFNFSSAPEEEELETLAKTVREIAAEAIREAVLAEREACARVAEAIMASDVVMAERRPSPWFVRDVIAAAIRQRS